MELTASPQEIRGILQKQRDISQNLLQVLDEEYVFLCGKDTQGLETTLAAKRQSLTQIEELSQNFLAAVHRHSKDKKEAVTAFLQHLDPQGAWDLESLWREVETLLSLCRQKNCTNGKVISLNQRHFHQALEILRQGGQDAPPCYSPSGAGQSPVSSRILGKV
jgi:flagellar biosynthesis/type III secretory pathway chaperone